MTLGIETLRSMGMIIWLESGYGLTPSTSEQTADSGEDDSEDECSGDSNIASLPLSMAPAAAPSHHLNNSASRS